MEVSFVDEGSHGAQAKKEVRARERDGSRALVWVLSDARSGGVDRRLVGLVGQPGSLWRGDSPLRGSMIIYCQRSDSPPRGGDRLRDRDDRIGSLLAAEVLLER